MDVPLLSRKTKRRYLLTLQVSRYCLLASQSSADIQYLDSLVAMKVLVEKVGKCDAVI